MGRGRGREGLLEATYKYINCTHVRIGKHNIGRSEEKSHGASGIPAWGPSCYRKHDFLPLVSWDKSPPRAQMILRQEGREKKVRKSFPWCKLCLHAAARLSAPGVLEPTIDPSREQPCYEVTNAAASQAGETVERRNKEGEGCLQTRLLNWLGWGPFHSSLHKIVVYFRWITTNSQIEPLSAVYTLC